jgi:hypothetical protein
MDLGPREEERQRGRVTRDMYMTYLRAWGPALLLPIAFVSIALIGSALEVHRLHLVSCKRNTKRRTQCRRGPPQLVSYSKNTSFCVVLRGALLEHVTWLS